MLDKLHLSLLLVYSHVFPLNFYFFCRFERVSWKCVARLAERSLRKRPRTATCSNLDSQKENKSIFTRNKQTKNQTIRFNFFKWFESNQNNYIAKLNAFKSKEKYFLHLLLPPKQTKWNERKSLTNSLQKRWTKFTWKTFAQAHKIKTNSYIKWNCLLFFRSNPQQRTKKKCKSKPRKYKYL